MKEVSKSPSLSLVRSIKNYKKKERQRHRRPKGYHERGTPGQRARQIIVAVEKTNTFIGTECVA